MPPFSKSTDKSMFSYSRKATSIIVLAAFMLTSVKSPVYAQTVSFMPILPRPGVMVALSPGFTPAYLQGITIHPDNALQFDFLIYKGDKTLEGDQKKEEYRRLVKYFLASLTIPDGDQWVNLSPYEHNRIIKDDFGKTEMGRDLLAEDYLLKQITSSLIYPEKGLGKKFWDTIYDRAWKEYHTTDIPVNTFNKVWILPDSAYVYESGNTAYILKTHMKVMLEEDYLSLEKHSAIASPNPATASPNDTHSIGSQVIRQIILPELEKEVNEGKNFATLRQMYSGMVLATWYKRALKESLLGKVYADRAKVKGVDQNPKNNQAIYNRYLRAFKKGVFNYIKDDVDKYTNQEIPRKYFSGGYERTIRTQDGTAAEVGVFRSGQALPAMLTPPVLDASRLDVTLINLSQAGRRMPRMFNQPLTVAGRRGLISTVNSLIRSNVLRIGESRRIGYAISSQITNQRRFVNGLATDLSSVLAGSGYSIQLVYRGNTLGLVVTRDSAMAKTPEPIYFYHDFDLAKLRKSLEELEQSLADIKRRSPGGDHQKIIAEIKEIRIVIKARAPVEDPISERVASINLELKEDGLASAERQRLIKDRDSLQRTLQTLQSGLQRRWSYLQDGLGILQRAKDRFDGLKDKTLNSTRLVHLEHLKRKFIASYNDTRNLYKASNFMVDGLGMLIYFTQMMYEAAGIELGPQDLAMMELNKNPLTAWFVRLVIAGEIRAYYASLKLPMPSDKAVQGMARQLAKIKNPRPDQIEFVANKAILRDEFVAQLTPELGALGATKDEILLVASRLANKTDLERAREASVSEVEEALRSVGLGWTMARWAKKDFTAEDINTEVGNIRSFIHRVESIHAELNSIAYADEVASIVFEELYGAQIADLIQRGNFIPEEQIRYAGQLVGALQVFVDRGDSQSAVFEHLQLIIREQVSLMVGEEPVLRPVDRKFTLEEVAEIRQIFAPEYIVRIGEHNALIGLFQAFATAHPRYTLAAGAAIKLMNGKFVMNNYLRQALSRVIASGSRNLSFLLTPMLLNLSTHLEGVKGATGFSLENLVVRSLPAEDRPSFYAILADVLASMKKDSKDPKSRFVAYTTAVITAILMAMAFDVAEHSESKTIPSTAQSQRGLDWTGVINTLNQNALLTPESQEDIKNSEDILRREYARYQEANDNWERALRAGNIAGADSMEALGAWERSKQMGDTNVIAEAKANSDKMEAAFQETSNQINTFLNEKATAEVAFYDVVIAMYERQKTLVDQARENGNMADLEADTVKKNLEAALTGINEKRNAAQEIVVQTFNALDFANQNRTVVIDTTNHPNAFIIDEVMIVNRGITKKNMMQVIESDTTNNPDENLDVRFSALNALGKQTLKDLFAQTNAPGRFNMEKEFRIPLDQANKWRSEFASAPTVETPKFNWSGLEKLSQAVIHLYYKTSSDADKLRIEKDYNIPPDVWKKWRGESLQGAVINQVAPNVTLQEGDSSSDILKGLEASLAKAKDELAAAKANLINGNTYKAIRARHGYAMALGKYKAAVKKLQGYKTAVGKTTDKPSVVGGIDFNAVNLAMLIKRDGHGVPLPVSRQNIQQLMRITGFDPEIVRISPASNVPIISEIQHAMAQAGTI